MFSARTLASVVVLTMGLLAPTVNAQDSLRAARWWAGGGHGSFGCRQSFRCDSFERNEARNALNAFVGVSRRVEGFLEAGLEVTTRTKDKGDSRIEMYTGSVLLLVNPPMLTRLRVRGIVGLAKRASTVRMDDILFNDVDVGQLIAGGITYDIPLTKRLSVTPGWEIGAIDFGSGRKSKMWEYRLALTWH